VSSELDPYNVDLWLNWSFVFYELGEFEKASNLVEEGINFLPEEAELYYRNAVYLIKEGKYKEAFLFLENGLTLDYDKHVVLFEFFKELETQKALFRIIDQYKK
jgi:tetratricopeptide (TPR) repeat protein